MSCSEATPLTSSPSEEVLAGVTREAAKLTDKEREVILGVLTKDEQLRRYQQIRIMHLKAELQTLRRKGALKVSDEPSSNLDPDRTCGRCRIELGRILNRGANCRICHLKVCKSCRDYGFRAPDWVCIVCYKRMEIQAASGEWMNEFVRKPSRRKDGRVYVPATDIIKRTIRRSWTISNPTPRWVALRNSIEARPYSSLPRGQDISNYPSLAAHQTNLESTESKEEIVKRLPTRRGASEDLPVERSWDSNESLKSKPSAKDESENILSDAKKADSENEKTPTIKTKIANRRVSFESAKNTPSHRSRTDELKNMSKAKSLPEDGGCNRDEDSEKNTTENHVVELCDIEPISGTVFRKMTVRRRRQQQSVRKITTLDACWRRSTENELVDILLPDGEDYRLVFVNSDSSSKEEDIDDNDSSSASSFPIDECDWDYFEPGIGLGSPRVCRKRLIDSPLSSPISQRRSRIKDSSDEEAGSSDVMKCLHQTAVQPTVEQNIFPCKSCGGCDSTTRYIPVPVPIPIPFPVPFTDVFPKNLVPIYKLFPMAAGGSNPPNSDIWQYLAQMQKHPWSMFEKTKDNEIEKSTEIEHLKSETRSSEKPVKKPSIQQGYNMNPSNDDENESEDSSSNVTSDNDEASSMSSDEHEDDRGSSDGGGKKKKKFSKVFVVNQKGSSSGSDASEDSESDNDTDTELDCGVVLMKVKQLDEEQTNDPKNESHEEETVTMEFSESDDDVDTVDSEFKEISSSKVEQIACDTIAINEGAQPERDSDETPELALAEEDPKSTEDGNKDSQQLTDEISVHEYKSYMSSPALSEVSADSGSSSEVEKEWNPVSASETATVNNACRDHTGVSVVDDPHQFEGRYAAAKYTSLVMITNENGTSYQNNTKQQQQLVNVVTTETTKLVREQVVVSHTNSQDLTSIEYQAKDNDNHESSNESNVTVITSPETLSAFEEGLADDDSWVENLSDDDFPTNSISENSSSGDEVTLTCSAADDQEDELRGYHRTAIDFTLHTIVEESCEESEIEQSPRKTKKESATDLEKYFFFGLGDGNNPSINRDDVLSETSSIYSEGIESLGGMDENPIDNPEELASSRLEKYFLSGFMGFTSERKDSDGSVGSDSEGKPSPEQRRKRLVRARGTGRSHSNSLDNLLGNPDLASSDQHLEVSNSDSESQTSDSDTYDESGFDKSMDNQFDTVKRKKLKKHKHTSLEDIKGLETTKEDVGGDSDEDRNKTPQPDNGQQQSRDSGFVGSCDDLLNEQKSDPLPLEQTRTTKQSFPPATNLTRKDSFNNWSSDEETNLMMSKMRQFFKTVVANNSKPSTPSLSNGSSPNPNRMRNRCKPPQLVYFENELTRLMKTVPGIREDQVREIVEYLSSEDTWSDSYDSSDYTSSDLEGACTKSALQQQISDSCKQIINKFDNNAEDEEGDAGDGGIIDDSHLKETAFVYQKLVASFEKIATDQSPSDTASNSPPLIAKVMHHIGSRLVALMHEVSSGESHSSSSPKSRGYHRRLQHKTSSASTTTDEDSTSDSNLPDASILPRSRSHDLLLDTHKNLQHTGNVSEVGEEREASDCERFSWRGSFESALLATDSRNKLSLIGGDGSASASALAIAAKRRSAGDLLFNHKSLSREQLDRVRSCGSIGGNMSEEKLWVNASKPNRRRSSVPDTASCDSADGEDEEENMENRATLPRSLQTGSQTTNSLPRLPTTSLAAMQKSNHFLSQNVKSARYRPPGFQRLMATQPKRALSAPGLQPTHQRRGRKSLQSNVSSDEVSLSEAHSSPMLATRTGNKSGTPSPVAPNSRKKTGSISSQEWPIPDDDIDRLVLLHHNRASLTSLGPRSDSMASVYSGADDGRYGSVTVRGQVEFGLQYDYKATALEIQIKQCKDLAPVDSKRNRSDPYVKVYLLPDKSKSGKRKTKVKKHTLNPVFDESLKFQISLNELENRTLWLSVWHSDMFGRNDFLGEVMMALENKVFDDPTPFWYNLQERTELFDDTLSYKGDIIVCLKFVPPDMTVHKKGKKSRGALHILVKEAKALCAVKANGTSDPFCKSYLLPEKGRNAKQKTPVIKKTVNPVWNYTFVYDDVTLQELAERSLELTVWDHDLLASNEFLGMVRFSLGTGKHYGKPVEWMDSTGKELNLWKNMLERPNFWVEGCLPLRPSAATRFT